MSIIEQTLISCLDKDSPTPLKSDHKFSTNCSVNSSNYQAREREREMEGIEHKMVEVNGIKMHVAEKGEGPVVVLVHGFPELWYSWRHQIVGLADKGYRAVAPDLRGYGETDAPGSISSYTIFHLVGDLVALIDALGQDQVTNDQILHEFLCRRFLCSSSNVGVHGRPRLGCACGLASVHVQARQSEGAGEPECAIPPSESNHKGHRVLKEHPWR